MSAGYAGYGGNGTGIGAGSGGKFPNGGDSSRDGGLGSFGDGGSGGHGGGGGGGFSGGGGGGVGYGAGGGGSYLASLVTDRVLTAGMNSEGGSISIDLIPAAVPEPSTWALMARGFAGLGLLAHMRKRKLTAV